MKELVDSINDVIKRVSGWIQSALDKLSQWLKRKEELKRQAEIEYLVTKLYRLDAIWRIPVDDLSYVQHQVKKDGRDFIWEVDYKHKYLFGRDD